VLRVPGLLALLPEGQQHEAHQHAQVLRVRVHVPGLLALLPGAHQLQEEEEHDLRLHDRLDQPGLRPYGLEQGGQAEDEQAEGDQDEQAELQVQHWKVLPCSRMLCSN